MSTRCNIIIKNADKPKRNYFLYHHHDGYPEGVGVDLIARLERGNFTRAEDFINALVKDPNEEYELTNDLHGDIEFVYEVTFKGWDYTGKANKPSVYGWSVPLGKPRDNEKREGWASVGRLYDIYIADEERKRAIAAAEAAKKEGGAE